MDSNDYGLPNEFWPMQEHDNGPVVRTTTPIILLVNRTKRWFHSWTQQIDMSREDADRHREMFRCLPRAAMRIKGKS